MRWRRGSYKIIGDLVRGIILRVHSRTKKCGWRLKSPSEVNIVGNGLIYKVVFAGD